MAQPRSRKGRLLAGEDPETIQPQDAQHWIDVYAEMIAFKRHMLDQVTAALEGVSAEARMDLKEDVALLEAQLARYERRSEFWAKQLERLEKSYPAV
jgi:predicted LPLAT superfamily acyltransferase